VWAKTGSIPGVNSLSGYIETDRQGTLTFSVEANHHAVPSRLIMAAIDSLVIQMVKR
jgi:D-alanyl-D-alanine carboxypeptidase